LTLDSQKKIFEKIKNLEKQREEEFNSDGEVNSLKIKIEVLEKDSIIERRIIRQNGRNEERNRRIDLSNVRIINKAKSVRRKNIPIYA
jgi:hypothetical protein